MTRNPPATWFGRPARLLTIVVALVGILALNALPLGEAQAQKKAAVKNAKDWTHHIDPDLGFGGTNEIDLINKEIAKAWKDNEITPSERCSDFEFIRRASLDIIGRIATIDELKVYMKKDPPKFRRSRLIARLLKSDEFAHNWANRWTTLLLTRSAPEVTRKQMYLFLMDEFSKTNPSWAKTARELISATGSSNEKGQVNFVLMHMGEQIKNKASLGRFDMVPVTSRTIKLFMGLQIQCSQCHNHPFTDRWQQHHFWDINGFFRQADAPNGRPQFVDRKNNNNEVMRGNFTLSDNSKFNVDGLIPYEPRNATLKFTSPRFIDQPQTRLPKNPAKTRRQLLAEFVTKSPYFGKAFVNRVWGHFMGMSFTKTGPADFGEHNPISHPELLEKLGKSWAENYDHDPRQLIWWICNSDAYQLNSVANKTNDSRDAERLFGRMLLKAMTPEQLFESVVVATQPKFTNNTDDRDKARKEFLERLVVNFGDDEGNEQTFNGTVVQSLLLMNSKELNNAIRIPDKKGTGSGTLAKALMHPTSEQQLMYLYLAALNRPPTKRETQRILKNPNMILLPGIRRPTTVQEAYRFRAEYYQDIFWALLNSSEFYLNH
ncbi:MAG: DUF1549 domain-containing protein [Gemmataceae bacterium]